MTPKEEYEQRKRARKAKKMAEDHAREARQKREQIADEAITSMLLGLRAFFEGRATLQLGPVMPGLGQSVRFYVDQPQRHVSPTVQPS